MSGELEALANFEVASARWITASRRRPFGEASLAANHEHAGMKSTTVGVLGQSKLLWPCMWDGCS